MSVNLEAMQWREAVRLSDKLSSAVTVSPNLSLANRSVIPSKVYLTSYTINIVSEVRKLKSIFDGVGAGFTNNL